MKQILICLLLAGCTLTSNEIEVFSSPPPVLPTYLCIFLTQSNGCQYSYAQNPVTATAPHFDDNAIKWRGIVKADWNLNLKMSPQISLAGKLAGATDAKWKYITVGLPGTGMAEHWNVNTGTLFAQAIHIIDTAITLMAAPTRIYVVRIQGERDAQLLAWSQAYLSNSTDMVDSLDSRYGIYRFIDYQLPDCLPNPYKDTVNAAKLNLAATHPKVRLMGKLPNGYYNADSTHVSIASLPQFADSIKVALTKP